MYANPSMHPYPSMHLNMSLATRSARCVVVVTAIGEGAKVGEGAKGSNPGSELKEHSFLHFRPAVVLKQRCFRAEHRYRVRAEIKACARRRMHPFTCEYLVPVAPDGVGRVCGGDLGGVLRVPRRLRRLRFREGRLCGKRWQRVLSQEDAKTGGKVHAVGQACAEGERGMVS